jgi:hypothetical protein
MLACVVQVLPGVEGGEAAVQAEQARRCAFFKPAFTRLILSIQARIFSVFALLLVTWKV